MGNTWSEFFPPKSLFQPSDIPDLSGKVILVTGGASGIGKETVKHLLHHNAKVYIAGRNQKAAEDASAELKKETGNEALFINLDLASLASVRRGAKDFISKETRLDALFNNGGVMEPDMELLSADGYDLQIGTNVLGHFYLTKLLLPTLLATAKMGADVRVVNTSSFAAQLDVYRIPTFVPGPARDKETRNTLYSQSKFANVVFALEFARRYGGDGIVSISLNPGNIRTNLGRYFSSLKITLITPLLYDLPFGALTPLYALTSPEAKDMNGKFLRPWARLAHPARAEALEPAKGIELWEWLDEQVQKFEAANP